MRVLVWNLFHGRADPPAGRPLLDEFAEALAGWVWDVALLQEVPPWWPPLLAGRCDADWRTALTSRNQLLPLRRAIASRAPDRLKSNGGGANAILVRDPWSIAAHGRRRLRLRPERRVVHAVRIERPTRADRPPPHDRAPARSGGGRPDEATGGTGGRGIAGAWIGNVHGQLGHWDDAAGMVAPLADLGRATAQLDAWGRTTGRDAPDYGAGRGTPDPATGRDAPDPATGRDTPGPGAGRDTPGHATGRGTPDHATGRGTRGPGAHARPGACSATSPASAVGPVVDHAAGPPIILGGDLNLPRDAVAKSLPPGWTRIASSGPDHVVGRGVVAVGPSQRPDRGTLSDHAPLLVEIAID